MSAVPVARIVPLAGRVPLTTWHEAQSVRSRGTARREKWEGDEDCTTAPGNRRGVAAGGSHDSRGCQEYPLYMENAIMATKTSLPLRRFAAFLQRRTFPPLFFFLCRFVASPLPPPPSSLARSADLLPPLPSPV